ncbi:MAG TPA: imidazolonepropionase [Bdellovibrionota bacterium]|jgi:imidazolonepropionase|nr:imidazolonepropionase [Bdellovibrionota bacterium]
MKPYLLLKNIRTLYSGQDLSKNGGRRPRFADLSRFKNIDVRCDRASGLILDVGFNLEKGSEDELLDASEYLATPSWVDSHTHTLFGGDRAKEFFMRWAGESYQAISAKGGGIHNSVRDTQETSDETLTALLTERLQSMLREGTGFVEIKTGYADSTESELRFLRLLKAFRTRASSDAQLPLISPTFLGLHAIPKGKTEYDFVREMIEILPTVAAEGLADHVDTFPEVGFFSLETSLDFARHAMTAGIAAKAHCDELSDLRSSEYFVAMGARSIDHLQKINKTAVQMLETSQTVATLMPATSFYLGLDYANARMLIDAGACLAIATDFNPGTAPNPSMSFTQTLAAKSLRMEAHEIFAASTHNAAKALGLESRVGTVVKGQLGNLNLYRAASLEELFFTTVKPELVINRGHVIGY